jgi:hypothetical protein
MELMRPVRVGDREEAGGQSPSCDHGVAMRVLGSTMLRKYNTEVVTTKGCSNLLMYNPWKPQETLVFDSSTSSVQYRRAQAPGTACLSLMVLSTSVLYCRTTVLPTIS